MERKLLTSCVIRVSFFSPEISILTKFWGIIRGYTKWRNDMR